jgi:hypothetical protein
MWFHLFTQMSENLNLAVTEKLNRDVVAIKNKGRGEM